MNFQHPKSEIHREIRRITGISEEIRTRMSNVAKELTPSYGWNNPEAEALEKAVVGDTNPSVVGAPRRRSFIGALAIGIAHVQELPASQVYSEINEWYEPRFLAKHKRENIGVDRAYYLVDNLLHARLDTVRGVEIVSCLQDGKPVSVRVTEVFESVEEGDAMVVPMPRHEIVGTQDQEEIIWGAMTGFTHNLRGDGEVTFGLSIGKEGLVKSDVPDANVCHYLAPDNPVSDGNTGFKINLS